MFENITLVPTDPMFDLKKLADSDISSNKVDLGVGIYRNEFGQYHELGCIREAKETLASQDPGHDYELTTGNKRFLEHAARLVLGGDCNALISHKVASVQTISGTGANHLGALLVSKCSGRVQPRVYIGTPAWGNYVPLFSLVGLETVQYNYYDSRQRRVDFRSCIKTVREAPAGSVFVLQGCCHNPTGADLDEEQWRILADEIKHAGHLPFLDIAYQGLGDGLEEDAFAIRHFATLGIEMIACQSFSKNFGLYCERVGALHVISESQATATKVNDQLRSLIRHEFSSSPAFGSRLVTIILEDEKKTQTWRQEVSEIRQRLERNRLRLFEQLTLSLKTPGDWSHILREKGLFSFLKLSPTQCSKLIAEYHIYLPSNGRINIAGLNDSCIERVAVAVDNVVRRELSDPSTEKRRVEEGARL